jgi:hypothetical protein
MNRLHEIDRENIIEFLRDNKPILEKRFGLTKIALFGSYARGEQHRDSDIDLAIETLSPSFEIRCELKDFLEQHFEKRVDLCYFSGMRRVVRSLVEPELIYA